MKALQVSKWLSCPALIEVSELKNLFVTLGSFGLYITSRLTLPGEETIPQEEFVEIYAEYINSLKAGSLPEENRFRHYFSAALSVTSETFTNTSQNSKQLLKVSKPIIQLQPFRMNYSAADNKFHFMSFGSDSILWGIQFSYPQLYQDPEQHQIKNIDLSPEFPNTALFKDLQKWMRNHTMPTPFLIGEQHLNISARIGKQCLPWINNHSQLIQQKIKVKNL